MKEYQEPAWAFWLLASLYAVIVISGVVTLIAGLT